MKYPKKIFISYDFSNNPFRGEVEKWLKEAGHSVIVVKEKKLHPEPDKQGQARINEQLQSADRLVVLLGDNTHNRPWVDYEVAVAKSIGLPVICVRLPNTTGAAPKEVRNLPEIPYEREAILNAVGS